MESYQYSELQNAAHWKWLGEQIVDVVAELEKTVEERDQAIQKLEVLLKENEKLKSKLRMYENPNTPSSAQRFKKAKKPKIESKEEVKRGAPIGHVGTTREVPTPDEDVEVTSEACPGCHATLGEPIGVEEKIIEDVIPEKRRVFRYKLYSYRCPECGKIIKSRNRNCPQKGRFGPNTLLTVAMFKFLSRAPVRKVAELMDMLFGMKLSPKAVLDMLKRTANACCSTYEALRERIRYAEWVHIDETSVRVNGKNWWIWVFRTDSDDVLTVIENSRSGRVPKRILGKHPPPVIVDGWSGYNWIREKQRCWAHLLREAEAVKDKSPAGALLDESLHALYHDLKCALELEDQEKRNAAKRELESRIRDIITTCDDETETMKRPIRYLRRGVGDWCTCLSHPGMPATNNLAEQAIREHVIQRKIIGSFRSEEGPANYACIASLLETWAYQGKDQFEEMHRLIQQELCLKE